MNDATVIAICVALIATPAVYAIERLYQEHASDSIGHRPSTTNVSEIWVRGSPFTHTGNRTRPATQMSMGDLVRHTPHV